MQYRTVLTVSVLGQLVLTTDYTLANAIMPSIARELDLTPSQGAWVVAADLLCFAGFLIFGGRLTDLLGIRRCFLWSVVAYAIGCIISAAAPTLIPLLIGRAIQGTSAAILSPASFAMLTVLIPQGKPRGKALGLLGMAQGVSLLIGILGAGVMAQKLGWRACFLINLPLLLLCFVLALRSVPVTTGGGWAMLHNIPSALLIVTGTSLLLWSLSEFGQGGSLSGLPGTAFVASLFAYGLLAHLERRSPAPLLSRAMLTRRTLAHGGSGFLVMIGSATFFLICNLQLQVVLDFSSAQASLALLPYAFAVLVGGKLGAMLTVSIGGRALGVLGALMLAGGLGLLLLTAQFAMSAPALVPGMVLAGLGGVLCLIGRMNDYSAGFPDAEQGTAIGLLFTLHQIGLAFGATAASSVITGGSMVSMSGRDLAPGYMVGIVAAIGAGVLLDLSRLKGLFVVKRV